MSKVRYLLGDEDRRAVIKGMKKYVRKKQEMDKLLEKIIAPLIKNKSLKILDACCGIGHIIDHLSKISPKSQFVGIDKKKYLIEEAKKLCAMSGGSKNIFKTANIFELSKYFKKEFDIIINWKTLSWLPRYEAAVKEMMKVAKKYIFISSLFYEGDIDFEIKVRIYKKESGQKGFNSYYNVYSLPTFKNFCYSCGAQRIKIYDFKMPIDLRRPSLDKMGTYTIKTDMGERLQISGTILMNWKIIKIEK